MPYNPHQPIPSHREGYSNPQGPKLRYIALGLSIVAVPAVIALTHDQQNVIPNTAPYGQLKEAGNRITAFSCFKDKATGEFGTLTLTEPEQGPTIKFSFVNYDTGKIHPLDSLSDAEVQHAPTWYSGPHNKTPLQCNTDIVDRGLLPHDGSVDGQLYQVGYTNALADWVQGPYNDKTVTEQTSLGYNTTPVNGFGDVVVKKYLVDQP